MATLAPRGPALEARAKRPRQSAPDSSPGPGERGNGLSWRKAILFGLIFAAIDLAIHIGVDIRAQSVGYGLFRDELYYIVCGRRLAWGYLDNQPVIAVVARFADLVFGHERLWTFRLVPSLAGAALVLIAGLLAHSLGGSRKAQAVAMIAVIGAPEYLGVDTILSMNCLEPVLWMVALLAVLEIAKAPSKTSRRYWWIAFGLAGGLALETKLSGGFFLVCLLAGLLATAQRRILLDRWAALGVALVLAIEAPNFVWQLRRGFPTIQWLVRVSHEGKDVRLGPFDFLWQQVLVLDPFSAIFWIAGLGWLLFGKRMREFRFAGLTALLFVALMLVLHAKIYYVVPVYPVLFAAGAVFCYQALPWTRVSASLPIVYMAVFAAATWYWMPVVLPIVPPAQYAKWEQRLGYRPAETENFRRVALPQLLADMTSWPSFAQQVAVAYNSLPPELRETPEGQLGIYCTNYGEASAVDVYGPAYGLPPAISGHQHYWYWGPRGELGNSLVIVGQERKELSKIYRDLYPIGLVHAPYAMPFEDGATIWYARNRLKSPDAIWKGAKELY